AGDRRRGGARDGPAHARSERFGPDAAGRRRRRDRHHRARGGRGRRPHRAARPLPHPGPMKPVDAVWGVGRLTLAPLVKSVTLLRTYGEERVPAHGGVVLSFNHFHWIDPPAFGAASPRTIYYMAKIEAHRAPGLGQLIRAFGTSSVRRRESDRAALRIMR